MLNKPSDPLDELEKRIKKDIKLIKESVDNELSDLDEYSPKFRHIRIKRIIEWFYDQIDLINNQNSSFGVRVSGIINIKERKCRINYSLPPRRKYRRR